MGTDREWPSVVAGNAALDFANTALAADGDPAGDVLADVETFLAWSRYVGLGVARGTERDRGALGELDRLRRATLTTALTIADRGDPPADAIDALRRIHAEGIRRAHASAAPSLEWSWPDQTPARQLAYLLADQAVELFRHGPLDRLKACPECRFVFLDASKNNSRRWCSMDDCGKRAKMSRYIAKRAGRAC